MDTIGDLCDTMGITVEKLRGDVEPSMMVCVHSETCSFGNCEHKWPHHACSEIGTCDYEPCVNMGVIACCTPLTD
jgi:hypothetical protein